MFPWGPLKTALKILQDKKPLAIFPQGTRDTTLDHALGGVGFLLSKTGAPLVVAKLTGTDKALPKGARVIKFHRIKIIYKRIKVPVHDRDYQAIAQDILEEIRNI